MIYPSRLQIIVGAVTVVVAGGAIASVDYDMHPSGNATSRREDMSLLAPVAAVHTASWYASHPAIAKRDEARCGDNAAAISPAACQNVESAEEQLLADAMSKAAVLNGASSNSNAMKSP